MAILLGMRQAYYSLFVVEAAERRVGHSCQRFVARRASFPDGRRTQQEHAPRNDSSDAGIGAGRHRHDRRRALPVGVLSPRDRAAFLQSVATLCPGVDFRSLSPQEASRLTGLLIRTCLQLGAAERVAYVDPKSERWSDRRNS